MKTFQKNQYDWKNINDGYIFIFNITMPANHKHLLITHYSLQ